MTNAEDIWQEAEFPDSVTPPMMIYDDPDASGSQYISVKSGNSSINKAASRNAFKEKTKNEYKATEFSAYAIGEIYRKTNKSRKGAEL